ncbi:Single-stranded DNA-binding protein [Mesomycoplasma hyorhinis HUB-1]|uniref:single-stranded DNA-binding protein n=1 Tax=Mesomycoplasma hyorhinis TaxID=2100 RepID=UPI0001E13419|nr:Single-stranded DNA-binding protein [Mesomycoplasma hyorhinis HUB-1]
MNKVILVGRIVNDLVLNRTKSGLDYLRFNLAIERRKFSADSEEITDFIPVVAWRFHAINIYTLSTKGSLILIEGYLSSGRYQKEDGTNVFTLDVVVDSFRSLETKEQLEQRKKKNVSDTAKPSLKNTSETVNEPTFINANTSKAETISDNLAPTNEFEDETEEDDDDIFIDWNFSPMEK